jgi:hypothetical protein
MGPAPADGPGAKGYLGAAPGLTRLRKIKRLAKVPVGYRTRLRKGLAFSLKSGPDRSNLMRTA